MIERVGEPEPLIEIGLGQLVRGRDPVRHPPSPSHSGGTVLAKSAAGEAACISASGTSVRVWAKRNMTRVTPADADP